MDVRGDPVQIPFDKVDVPRGPALCRRTFAIETSSVWCLVPEFWLSKLYVKFGTSPLFPSHEPAQLDCYVGRISCLLR